MSTHTFSRLETAKLQLRQAIRLFFGGGDVISIHSLCMNAHEVIYASARSTTHLDKIKSSLEQKVDLLHYYSELNGLSKKETKKLINHRNKFRNFVKHGGRNQLFETMDFDDSINILIIMDCVCALNEMHGVSRWDKDFVEFDVFKMFFRNTEGGAASCYSEVFEECRTYLKL